MPEPEYEITGGFLKRLFVRRKLLIFGLPLVGIVLGVLWWAVAYPVYKSKGSIELATQNRGFSAMTELMLLSGGSSEVENEINIMKSRSISDVVIGDLGLAVDVRDVTHGGPLERAVLFVLADRLKRNVRAVRVKGITFPSVSVKKHFFVTFTDDSGGFRVEGPGGELGTGRTGQPFQSEKLSLTVESVKGPSGSRFMLTPRSSYDTMKHYLESLAVSQLGGAGRTDLIQVSYEDRDPTLAADVVNKLINEYESRDKEWNLSQGTAQVSNIDTQIENKIADLDDAEAKLETYKRENKVIVLGQEVQLAVTQLATREAERSDVELRLSLLQGIYSSLSGSVSSDNFTVPPTLTEDVVIQQLAADHARLTVELSDLLLEYTETHPLVIAKKGEIVRVRQNILGVLDATVKGLEQQQSSLSGVISQMDARLNEMPGVEKTYLDLTRRREVAVQLLTVLYTHKSEADVLMAGTSIGNRTIDDAVPPDRHVWPRFSICLLISLGSSLALGLFLAFLVEQRDPRLMSLSQLGDLLEGTGEIEIEMGGPEGLTKAVGALALAAMRAGNRMMALTTLHRDSTEMRDFLEKTVKELSSGLSPILLVDGSTGEYETSFFGAQSSPGLSEAVTGGSVKAGAFNEDRIVVLPPGKNPSSACVASGRVRDEIAGMSKTAALTILYAPGQASDPAQYGWSVIAGAVVLVVVSEADRTDDVRGIIHRLRADEIPIIGAILLKRK